MSGSSVSFNGTGTRGTTFMTDGVSDDDGSENQNRQAVNISTIKEMQLLTDNLAPEFVADRRRGAGANEIRRQHDARRGLLVFAEFGAGTRGAISPTRRGYADPPRPAGANVAEGTAQSHRAGGTLGSAIIKDRLSYFGWMERFWEPGTLVSTSYLLPPGSAHAAGGPVRARRARGPGCRPDRPLPGQSGAQ